MSRQVELGLAILVLIFLPSLVSPTTIHVPADQQTIQEGIDAAVDGDTVLVADGTYAGDGNRDIEFFGKAIVVVSENGPEHCLVDCENVSYHRGFAFNSGESRQSILQGFRIKDCTLSGVYCQDSSPTITGNIISGNTGSWGAGIACWDASPLIRENLIIGNSADNGGGISCGMGSSPEISSNTIVGNEAGAGGGIYSSGSSPAIMDNMIVVNSSSTWAGGIGFFDSSPTIVGNTIDGNMAPNGSGGGIYSYLSFPVIRGNTITRNVADGSLCTGGGIVSEGGISIIERNLISGNKTDWGGGIWVAHGFSEIRSNIVADNTADVNGGGIDVWYASADVRNNTISENSAGSCGGGISCEDSCTVIVVSSIFWNNDAGSGDEIALTYDLSQVPSSLTIDFSDVEGGEDSVFVDAGCSLHWGDEMFDEDPLFIESAEADYHIRLTSPCIDAGDPSLIHEPEEKDIDGQNRIMRGRVDMGADEVPYPHYKEAIQVE